VPGAVMAIHTFGADPEKWHPQLHILSTDGLFRDTGTFYIMKDVNLKPLAELFRAELFRFLKKEGKITDDLINKLIKWRHSGFSVDNGVRIKKEDKEGTEAIAQYMMRNVISTENIYYVEKTGKVIYHTGKIQKGKNKNFAAMMLKSSSLPSHNIFPRNRSRLFAIMAITQINPES